MADVFQECGICVFRDRPVVDYPCRDCYIDGCPHNFHQAAGTGPEATLIVSPSEDKPGKEVTR